MTGQRNKFKNSSRIGWESNMRYLNRLIGSAAIAVAFATPSFAQQGSNLGGGNMGGGNLGGGNLGGGNLGSGNGGMGSQNGSQGGSTPNAFQLQQIDSAPTITAPGSSTTGRAGSSVISQSNIFSATYGNPLYQGIPANAKSNSGPGGFGAPLYTITAAGSAAGGRGVTQARGFGGAGGLGASSQQSGVIVQLPVQISYQAVAKFPITPVAAPQLQADIAGMISRTTEVANPAGVSVSAEGNTVTLRGNVKDLDEAKTLVSMVRMTPGVRAVKNELTFPK